MWNFQTFASLITALTAAALSLVAYFGIPPNPKESARAQIDQAVALYPIIQDGAISQRNAWFKLVREQVAEARYSSAEIAAGLANLAEGKRLASLVAVQWQWPDVDGHEELNSERYEDREDRALAERQRGTAYFPQLYKLVVRPHRAFEQYHAIVAI